MNIGMRSLVATMAGFLSVFVGPGSARAGDAPSHVPPAHRVPFALIRNKTVVPDRFEGTGLPSSASARMGSAKPWRPSSRQKYARGRETRTIADLGAPEHLLPENWSTRDASASDEQLY